MRNVPGTVSIVTTGIRPGRHGLTLTAGCSLSTEPSRVLVCVNKSAGAHDTIKASQAFCWNILAAQHSALARTFSGQDGIKGDVRFTEGLWQTLVTGAPSLIEAICSLIVALSRRMTPTAIPSLSARSFRPLSGFRPLSAACQRHRRTTTYFGWERSMTPLSNSGAASMC